MADHWEVIDAFTSVPGRIYGLALNGRVLVKWQDLDGVWGVYFPQDKNFEAEFTTRAYAEAYARELVHAPGITAIPDVFKGGE